MNKQTLLFFLLISLLSTLGNAQSVCDTNRIEIPNNGLDEDCDGLDGLFMHLPPYIYATQGQDFELYYRNTVLSRHPQHYQFRVRTALWGNAASDRWVFVPTAAQIGEYPLTLYVQAPNGQILDSARTIVRVTGNSAPADTQMRHIVLLGHSFFDQGYLPKYVHDLTKRPNNPLVQFHGKKVTWADSEARHEGHGGWTWHQFAHTAGSPLRYNNKLNLRRYFQDVMGGVGRTPDYVIVYLDINDFCGYSPLRGYTLQEIDDTIRVNWDLYARPILDSIRAAAPNTKIAVCYTPAPSASQKSFSDYYNSFNPTVADRWRWQKIVSRLAMQNTRRYAQREGEGFYLIPTHLDIDDVLEYGPNDPVHPAPRSGNPNDPSGYREIAKSIYAWMRYAYQLPRNAQPRTRWFRDADGDGFGNASIVRWEFEAPSGFVSDSTDCDDSNPRRYPRALEIPRNNIDDDCDGLVDETTGGPIARCKANLSMTLDYYGRGRLNANQVDAGSVDEAGGIISLAIEPSTFDCKSVGVQTVKLTATNATGNVATCETRVTIFDTLPPIVKTNWPSIYLRFIDSINYGAVALNDLVSTDERCLRSWEASFDSVFTPVKDIVWFSCDLLKKKQPLTLHLRATDVAGNQSLTAPIKVILQGGCGGYRAFDQPRRAQVRSQGYDVKIHPNPAHDWLLVRTEEMPLTQWALYDATGRLVQQERALNTQELSINLATVKSGLYALKVWRADGSLVTRMVSVL